MQDYQGDEPFASYQKKYFSQHKKFGGQDRKWVSQLCYSYFRLGKIKLQIPAEEKILLGLFLVSNESNLLLAELRPEWNARISDTLTEKMSLSGYSFSLMDIFPWHHELSLGMDIESFEHSFLVQPDLFLRIRPGAGKRVKVQLSEAKISFEEIDNDTLALPNNTRIDDHIALDRDAVVQDLNSQRIGNLLEPLKGKVETIWDCCAASGGKSIMAKDILGKIQITVSDIRSSILANLKKRFAAAGISKYESFVADLTAEGYQHQRIFDLVIADVPCTGSGTWSRTPEQLYYFDPRLIESYSSRQQKILLQASKSVRPGGYLLYSTCSVFKRENEIQVSEFVSGNGWTVERMELFKGYTRKADTLFAALLRKPS